MVKRIAPVGVVSFVLLAACGAVCQNVRESLPDSPSVQAPTQAQGFNGFVEGARSPFEFGAMGSNSEAVRQGGFAVPNKAVSNQEESKTIFEKYLRPSSLKQQSGDHSSDSGSLMGRATYAASRIVVMRDGSGKARLNTSYLLRTLTSVAADTASRPYWRRSLGEPFSDFGSTVGNDAGMNVWHELGPGIQQLMKSHAPKYVSKIEARVGHH
jgi:hypothetical protein